MGLSDYVGQIEWYSPELVAANAKLAALQAVAKAAEEVVRDPRLGALIELQAALQAAHAKGAIA